LRGFGYHLRSTQENRENPRDMVAADADSF
jgi:hypothetical protein